MHYRPPGRSGRRIAPQQRETTLEVHGPAVAQQYGRQRERGEADGDVDEEEVS
jgi:hypothetical protein